MSGYSGKGIQKGQTVHGSIGLTREQYIELLGQIASQLETQKDFKGKCGKYYYKYKNSELTLSEKPFAWFSGFTNDDTQLDKEDCEIILHDAKKQNIHTSM